MLMGISRYIENLKLSLSSYQRVNDKNSNIISKLPEKGYYYENFSQRI